MEQESTREKSKVGNGTAPVDGRPTAGGAGGARGAMGGDGMGMGMGMGMGGGGGGGGALNWRDLRTFSSLGSPIYRLYYGALLGQMAAMNMQMIARALLIYRISGSATVLGLMALANAVPMLFFSLFGGVIADRVQKKHVLLAGSGANAVVTLGVGLLITFGYLSPAHPASWWILIVSSLLQGTVMGLMMPARQAMVAEIVGTEQLMNAVALNTLGMNGLRLLAPAAAGFLIDVIGFDSVYYVMTGLYLLAVVFVIVLPRTGTITLRGRGAMSEMVEGLRYVRSEVTLVLILVVSLFIVLFSMPYMALLPVFTEDVLKVGASGMGALISLSGVGAMAGSLVLASLPNKKRGLMMMMGSLVLGVGLVAFSFSASFAFSLGAMVVVGLGQTFRMTLGNTLLQYYVSDEYRGRVMALYMMEFGLSNFGTFFAAIMADVMGVQWSVGGLAIALIVLCIGTLIFSPRLRRLD